MKTILTLSLIGCLATQVFAQNSNTPPKITVQAHNLPMEDGSSVIYAIMEVDGSKMGFEVPDSLNMYKLKSGGIAFNPKDGYDATTMSIAPFIADTNTITSPKEAYIQDITQQYVGATITTEHSLSAGGVRGSAFDAKCISQGQTYIIRTAYIPFGKTILRFQFFTATEKFKQYKGLLNTIMVTFRKADATGEVPIPHFSTKV